MSQLVSYHLGDYCSEEYDSVEFTLADGQTDYDLDAQQDEFLNNVTNPYYMELYTDQNISIKFNSTTNKSITINSTDSPRKFDKQIIKNIYLTNASGSAANVRMYIKGEK